MKLISLTETDDWHPETLTGHEADLLLASGLVDVRPASATHHRWSLRAASAVGAAVLRDSHGTEIDLRIKPKVDVRRLLFLMGYAKSPKAWRTDWVDLPKVDELPPAISEALARLTDHALRAGLLQGYQTIDEAGMTVRGRVRHIDQFRRHFGQLLPVEVTYDEFTTDIAENQILRAALIRMLKVPGLPEFTRRRLAQPLHRLDEISDLIPGKRLPTWTRSRLNARYGPALQMAGLVLACTSFDLARGDVRASGFMMSMPGLFEDFVTKALGSALVDRAGGRVEFQDTSRSLDSDAKIQLRPDLVWYPSESGGAPGIVVDAKYKAEKVSGFPNADVYQMLAYCTSLELRSGYLIYAKGNEDGAVYSIPGAGPGGEGVAVAAYPINLDADPRETLVEVDSLATQMLAASRKPADGDSIGHRHEAASAQQQVKPAL